MNKLEIIFDETRLNSSQNETNEQNLPNIQILEEQPMSLIESLGEQNMTLHDQLSPIDQTRTFLFNNQSLADVTDEIEQS